MLTDEMRQKLIEAALKAREWAYAPYSKYRVGAALLTSSGRIYDGVNVENAAYPSSMCAERVALFKAVSEGERSFDALAVASFNGGTPCGACRQVLAEFGQDTVILVVDAEGKITHEGPLSSFLPAAFRGEDLKTTR
jgi:cytidine deaminase